MTRPFATPSRKRSVTPFIVCLCLGVMLGIWSISVYGSNSYYCGRHVSGHIKRAATASTVPIAREELGKALEGARQRDWDYGRTSEFMTLPEYDIGYWYQNLTAAYDELALADSPSVSQLEKTNVLLKLRETLTERDNKGNTSAALPEMLYAMPYGHWTLSAGVIGFLMFIVGIVGIDYRRKI